MLKNRPFWIFRPKMSISKIIFYKIRYIFFLKDEKCLENIMKFGKKLDILSKKN